MKQREKDDNYNYIYNFTVCLKKTGQTILGKKLKAAFDSNLAWSADDGGENDEELFLLSRLPSLAAGRWAELRILVESITKLRFFVNPFNFSTPPSLFLTAVESDRTGCKRGWGCFCPSVEGLEKVCL